MPWWGVDDTLAELGDLGGKILIDVTNPYTDETYTRQHEFPDSSGAEEIQKKAPGAGVVKCWNHVFAQIVQSTPFGGVPASVFLCGDDPAPEKPSPGWLEPSGTTPSTPAPCRQLAIWRSWPP